jgi:hypothetical protein
MIKGLFKIIMYGILGLFAVGLIMKMFGGETEKKVTKNPVSTGPATLQREAKPIPYKIIKTDQIRTKKMSYSIMVDLVEGRLPSKPELSAISNKLKSNQHERTFVEFYLPGMEVGNGAFATAHHNPDMQVIILDWALPEKYKTLLK